MACSYQHCKHLEYLGWCNLHWIDMPTYGQDEMSMPLSNTHGMAKPTSDHCANIWSWCQHYISHQMIMSTSAQGMAHYPDIRSRLNKEVSAELLNLTQTICLRSYVSQDFVSFIVVYHSLWQISTKSFPQMRHHSGRFSADHTSSVSSLTGKVIED